MDYMVFWLFDENYGGFDEITKIYLNFNTLILNLTINYTSSFELQCKSTKDNLNF